MLTSNNLIYFNKNTMFFAHLIYFLYSKQLYNCFSNYRYLFFFINTYKTTPVNKKIVKPKISYNSSADHILLKTNQWNTRKSLHGLFRKLKKKPLNYYVYTTTPVLQYNHTKFSKNLILIKAPHFVIYYFYFFKPWNFLIGNLISPFSWDFTPQKKSHRLINTIRLNYNKQAPVYSLNLQTGNTTPATALNYAASIIYKNLLFNLLSISEIQPQKIKNIFHKPYSFFNFPNLTQYVTKTTIDTIATAYNNYDEIFYLLKRFKFSLLHRQTPATIFNQYYKIIYNLKKRSSFPNLKFSEITRTEPYVKLFQQNFVLKKTKIFWLKQREHLKKIKKFDKLNSFIELLSLKKCLIKNNKYLFFVHTKKTTKKLKIAIFYRFLLEKNNKKTYLSNTNNVFTQINLSSVNNFKICNNTHNQVNTDAILLFSNLNYNFICKKYDTILNLNRDLNDQWENSYIYKKLQLPLFFTYEKTNFSSDIDGFIYLNDWILNELFNDKIYNVKRLSYSFITKNEIHKFILKKFSKNVWTGTDHDVQLNALKDSNFLIKSAQPPIVFQKNDINTTSHLTLLTNYSFKTKKWNLFKNQFNLSQSFEEVQDDVNISRIRFKPGYSSQWREARSNLKLILELKKRYQYRLTRYLMRFLKFDCTNFFLLFEMELQNILFKSRFIPDKSLSQNVITSNTVYVNGILCNNLKYQIYINDFIQLIISLKYFILYRQLVNWTLKKKTKLRQIITSKLPSQSETEDKKRSNHLSNRILANENLNEDILKYCEIDYFTLSIFVIYEPLSLHDINYYNLIRYRPVTFRLYNWKYIT